MFARIAASPGSDLPPAFPVPFAVASYRPRVDWVDGEPGIGESDDEQVRIGLDGDWCVLGCASVLRNQAEEFVESDNAGVDPGSANDPTLLVGECNVVMDFGPIDSAGNAHLLPFRVRLSFAELGVARQPNGQRSRRGISQADHVPWGLVGSPSTFRPHMQSVSSTAVFTCQQLTASDCARIGDISGTSRQSFLCVGTGPDFAIR